MDRFGIDINNKQLVTELKTLRHSALSVDNIVALLHIVQEYITKPKYSNKANSNISS